MPQADAALLGAAALIRQEFEAVLSAGKEVIKRKGATFYGIAQTVLRILTAILRDEKSILTVSTKVQGYADANGKSIADGGASDPAR